MMSVTHLPHHEHGERMEIFLKRHWYIFFTKIIFHLVLFAAPVIFYWLIGDSLYGSYDSDLKRPLLILGGSVYYLSVWIFFTGSFISDFLDYWIVTNMRILSINQIGLFSRTVAELKLSRVQDVTSEVKGYAATFLNYGNIYIQTAGEQERFIFKQVPNAEQVAQSILHLVEKYKHEHHDD